MKDSLKQKKALIIGVTGQDGAYLSKFLLDKEYLIYGSSRNSKNNNYKFLEYLKIDENIQKIQLNPLEYESVYKVIKDIRPHEIYYLSAQSSVSLSFAMPAETINSILFGLLNVLEAVRSIEIDTKIYNAGSSEVFGNTKNEPANELSEFSPLSPYGLAKAFATKKVSMYRDLYGLHASTGILFNHESPLRPDTYVTKKIIKAAYNIANNKSDKLKLGNIDIYRDWGYAPDYVEAMWKILQLDEPQDFLIGTGKSLSLKDFTNMAFNYFGLNWKEHTLIDKSLIRSSDIKISSCDPTKAKEILDWQAKTQIEEIIEHIAEYEIMNHEKE